MHSWTGLNIVQVITLTYLTGYNFVGVIGKFSVLCRVLGLTGFLDQC